MFLPAITALRKTLAAVAEPKRYVTQGNARGVSGAVLLVPRHAEYEAFDQLPKRLKDFMNDELPCPVSAVEVLRILKIARVGIPDEKRALRFVMEFTMKEARKWMSQQ